MYIQNSKLQAVGLAGSLEIVEFPYLNEQEAQLSLTNCTTLFCKVVENSDFLSEK